MDKGERYMVLFVCKDHLELAIDIIVDELEKAPEILTLEQAGIVQEVPPKPCARCEAIAQFVVS
jgi:CxxH/CxxC protein (TIGR04129 family)